MRTPGIDIGNYEVAGVGPLCIWDTAGQIEFHVTHSMFLGSENAMAVILYDLRGGRVDVNVSRNNKQSFDYVLFFPKMNFVLVL